MGTVAAILALVAGLIVWAGIWYVAGVRSIRARTGRIERSGLDVPEKVHRLQRLMLICSGAMLLGYAVLGGGLGAVGHGSHASGDHRHLAVRATAVAVLGVAFLIVIIACLWMLRTVRGGIARVRDVPVKGPNQRRARLAGLAGGLVYAALLVGGLQLVPAHGTGHAVGRVLVYVVGLFVFVAVIVPLITLRMLTRPMPADQAQRFAALAQRIGVHVRGFRVLKTRTQKVANAAQLGLLPGLRYVMVTDYLVDHMDEGQLDAVVAHELGHARGHHLIKKFAVVLGAWAVLEGIIVGVGSAAGSSSAWQIGIFALIVLIPIGMLLAQGVLGVRLENAADDTAARCVGADEIASALQRLGQLNDTKPDTGHAWSILTQHPGLKERVDRLRAQAQRPAGRQVGAAS